eukprot:TRINITY_DN14945_c1_g1_i2.p1 TRINITY_DN14945_c1_g1~~TRINITY_DN14945_c1_g1_i2.p1  ORF type:complete len:106 (+),score=5.88 TRINITY_DN14945_c1_g1_i2:369-686(+)
MVNENFLAHLDHRSHSSFKSEGWSNIYSYRLITVKLDDISIESWKCLVGVGVFWLTRLFNKILMTKKMPDECKRSIVVPICKNKVDIQTCINYCGIKLMSHIMKL